MNTSDEIKFFVELQRLSIKWVKSANKMVPTTHFLTIHVFSNYMKCKQTSLLDQKLEEMLLEMKSFFNSLQCLNFATFFRGCYKFCRWGTGFFLPMYETKYYLKLSSVKLLVKSRGGLLKQRTWSEFKLFWKQPVPSNGTYTYV